MKKLSYCSTMLIFVMLIGCKHGSTSVDLKIEKAEIQKLLDLEMALYKNDDKQGVVNFYRKYYMPQSYLLSGDTLIIAHNLSKSDEEEITGSKRQYPSVSDIFPPIITLSPDGRMAYVILKQHFEWKKDSIEGKMSIARFRIYNKVDSIWKIGDSMFAYETADILASSKTRK
jgi:hypothetical protein